MYFSRKTDTQFEAIAFEHKDSLYNVALHLTKHKLDAEDLVQETYLKAYRFFSSFQMGTNFRAWIFKILYNNFINLYRKRTKIPSKVDFETVESSHADEINLESENYVQKSYKEIFDDEISGALSKVPTHYRSVLLLVDVNGISYQEAAAVLKCPMGTVMSRLSRARQKLRRLLKPSA